MKLFYVVVLLLLYSISVAQDENQIRFTKKKNPDKFLTYDLPLIVDVKLKGQLLARQGFLFEASGSSFKMASHHVLGPLSMDEVICLEKCQAQQDSIFKSRRFSHKEKREIIDSLNKMSNGVDAILLRIDTLTYQVSELKKIKVHKPKPSKFVFTSAIILYSVSSMTFIAGLMSPAGYESKTLKSRKRQEYTLTALGGLGGMLGSWIWARGSRLKVYKIEKWNMREEFNVQTSLMNHSL